MKLNRVILFGPYPPPYGGVATYISNLDKYLSEIFSDYVLVKYSQNGDFSVRKSPGFFDVYSVFKNRIAGNKTICVDSCSFFIEYPNYKRLIAWLLLKFKYRFKWIKVIHDSTLPVRYKCFSFIEKICVNVSLWMADDIIVVSNELRDWLENNFLVKNKIVSVNSLLPIDRLFKEETLKLNNLKLFDYIVCSIGVFIPTYGFQDVVQAIENIRVSSGENVGLILIDGGFSEDSLFKENILKDKEWIIVLSKLSNIDVLTILKKSNVFVRAARSDSYGLSKVEALLCGIPVVSTNSGETRGMSVYKYGDISGLINKIEDVLFNKDNIKEVVSWKGIYESEANSNLQKLIDIIKRHE